MAPIARISGRYGDGALMAEPNNGRTGRAGWAMAAILWLTPLASVAGGMALAPLQGLAGLVATPDPRRFPRATLRRAALAAAPLALFLTWGAVSLSWSVLPRPEQALKNASACLTGLLLIVGVAAAQAGDRARVRATLIAALVVLSILLGIEAAFDMPLNRLDEAPGVDPGVLERNPGKGVSILVALLWGGLAALMDGGRAFRWGAVALLATAAALSTQFDMAANAFGLGIGVCGFALGWMAPRLGPALAAGAAALWLLAAPWATPTLLGVTKLTGHLPMSWRMRGEIWGFAHDRIAEKPVAGWGLDASRSFSDQRLEIDGLPFQAIPLHPHSFSMQVWLETGAIGAFLMAAALLAGGIAGVRAFSGSRAAAAALTGTIAAVAAIWNVSYGAWQEWWMATAFLALAGATAARR